MRVYLGALHLTHRHESRAVSLPGECSDCVEIGDLLGRHLLPHVTSWGPVVYTKPGGGGDQGRGEGVGGGEGGKGGGGGGGGGGRGGEELILMSRNHNLLALSKTER